MFNKYLQIANLMNSNICDNTNKLIIVPNQGKKSSPRVSQSNRNRSDHSGMPYQFDIFEYTNKTFSQDSFVITPQNHSICESFGMFFNFCMCFRKYGYTYPSRCRG